MTEGVLLRQALGDGSLRQYDVVVVDEVHERHVTTDLLLGLLKSKVLPAAPNLRVLLMSATVNVKLFGGYFPGLPPARHLRPYALRCLSFSKVLGALQGHQC